MEQEAELVREYELRLRERAEAVGARPRQQVEHEQQRVAVRVGHRVVEGGELVGLVEVCEAKVLVHSKLAELDLQPAVPREAVGHLAAALLLLVVVVPVAAAPRQHGHQLVALAADGVGVELHGDGAVGDLVGRGQLRLPHEGLAAQPRLAAPAERGRRPRRGERLVVHVRRQWHAPDRLLPRRRASELLGQLLVEVGQLRVLAELVDLELLHRDLRGGAYVYRALRVAASDQLRRGRHREGQQLRAALRQRLDQQLLRCGEVAARVELLQCAAGRRDDHRAVLRRVPREPRGAGREVQVGAGARRRTQIERAQPGIADKLVLPERPQLRAERARHQAVPLRAVHVGDDSPREEPGC